MFRNLALKAVLAAGLTTPFAFAEVKTDISTLAPPFAIFLNGFCDFFLVTQNGLLFGAAHVQSTFCGFPDGLASGSFGLTTLIPPFGSIPTNSYNVNSTVNFPQSLFYLFNVPKGTWANYGYAGTTVFPINFGTFTIGPPPVVGAKISGRPSSQKQ
jgi:hypothetical protein